ncbi:PAS domain S-box-containing protein [Sphingomonas laterariae]|uniref:histidine kinase n=2 Tax=Edaphosphingomonas laterariae TaxID=861865 RepID=A0A239HEM8_9SPHN|nr:PAS domain S-box-containing protein [Sphingomonas laterariae]
MDETGCAETPLTEDGRYRLLVDAITDHAIYMLDLDGRVTNWNTGAQRLKGYRADEIVGRHFSSFYTDEDRAAGLPRRALEIAASTGKFEQEGWRVRKDGERFWAHVTILPIVTPESGHIGYAKLTRDLTERQRAEADLMRQDQQFRLLVQSVTDYAIYMLDADGLVSSWNPGAARIKGYSEQEIIGRHFETFYTEEDRLAGAPARALETARREGRFLGEGWRVRRDGSHFRANVVIDPIHASDGQIIGFAKITRDVTERVEAQIALEQAHEQLFQAQKLDAIGRLTGGIAHDFNNLLMAILSSLELLRKRLPDDPHVQRLLDNAVMGADRGVGLTQRMLAFARRQHLKPVRVAVPALVHGMTDLLQRSLGPAWPIEARFPLDLCNVKADANQLEMALLNLIVNARDAMPDGGVITVSGRDRVVGAEGLHGLPAGPYVVLSVSDPGTGMDAETLSRATEPFFTTKGVGKGTGLGLSMIHGLIEQLGGKFVLQSSLGEGTTAELWLPAMPAPDAPAKATATAANVPAAARPLNVLVVDDDALVLINSAALLEDLGHVPLEAASAEAGLTLLHSHPEIDLIMTDQAMPNVTGVELIVAARAERPDIPAILATGYGELPDDIDFKFFKLQKPFSQIDLARALSAVIA